jgi:hypothetical protein
MRLALADALDLWCVQGIDLATALAPALFQHPSGQEQRPRERLPQTFVPNDVPLDVADDAAKIGLELAQAPVGAFELMGVGVTLVRDQCQLADPSIGLAALNKCLAKSNKSHWGSRATKRRNDSASVWKPRAGFRSIGHAALMSQPNTARCQPDGPVTTGVLQTFELYRYKGNLSITTK